jgi:hypothetical protein
MGTRDRKRISNERREYFRIDDDIFLSYTVLMDDSLESAQQSLRQRGSRQISITSELNRISKQLNTQLKTMKRRQPETARCLEALNEKIDLLVQYALIRDPDAQASPNKHVSISASGMAFVDELCPATGDYLQLSFKLFPSFREIDAIAQVVSVSTQPQRDASSQQLGYTVAVQFVLIDNKDREALQEHTLTTELRRKRQQAQSRLT